jgi:hypothetical protein
MAALLFRLMLLATGLGVTEIGLGNALAQGSPWGWVLALLVGLPLIVVGSAGFMITLLGGGKQKGTPTDG